MVFLITVIANFSIGGTFTAVVTIFAKLAFFNYLCSLSGALTSRFWVFWNLVQIVVSFDLRISQTCLRVSSAPWPADITLGRVNSDSQRRRSLKELSFAPQTIMKSFKFTFWTKLFQFCDEVMEFLPFMLSICKSLMTKYSDVFSWVAVFKELL